MSPRPNPELVTTFRIHGSHDFSAGAQLDAMGHPGLGHIDVSGGGPKNQFGKWAVFGKAIIQIKNNPKWHTVRAALKCGQTLQPALKL